MNKVKREKEDKTKTYEQILREGTLLAAKLIEKHDDGILTNSSYCLGALLTAKKTSTEIQLGINWQT